MRAIDLTLKDLFGPTMDLLFPGNPLEHLDAYRRLTEWSLLADVERWPEDPDPEKRRTLGEAWRAILQRRVPWKMACERTIQFEQGQSELASIFTERGAGGAAGAGPVAGRPARPAVPGRRGPALPPPDQHGRPAELHLRAGHRARCGPLGRARPVRPAAGELLPVPALYARTTPTTPT